MKTIVEENTFVDYIREEETIGWGGGMVVMFLY